MELTSVVAKMACHSVDSSRWGSQENCVTHKVNLGAVCGKEGENKDFSDATPSGQCWMNINTARPALSFFKPGKKYYVTFTEAPD